MVEFDGQMVTITRNAFGAQGRGVKSIPLSSIGSVQLRRPSAMAIVGDGVWSISVAGEVQSSSSKRGRGVAKKAAREDENSVVIGPGHVKAFQALTDEINAAKARGSMPAVPVAPVAAPVNAEREAVIAQLRQLGSMHHQGVIEDRAILDHLHSLLPRL